MTIALIVIVAIIVIAVLYFIAKRNSIIASRNRVDESWSGIDVQLKRRHDLVPKRGLRRWRPRASATPPRPSRN